ncbi:MAG: hypothetical protein U1E14_13390 [Geminicoccaceae bacterium]
MPAGPGDAIGLSLERCDPGGVLRAALAGPPPPDARSLWLGWVLGLPSDIDAALAAGIVLRASGETRGHALGELLVETLAYPRARLASMGRRGVG